ncbi:MAG: type I restriction-modification enzyme R subunit C-terminal domain-containing protein, partial [Pseudonocardia sp.]
QQQELLDELAGDLWWIDVTLPLLEHVRLRIRGLVRFVERSRRNPVYTDFADELGQATEVVLPGVTPGTNLERFRAKASAYLRRHEDHVALQRLRRNTQLTPNDVTAMEQMLLASGAGEQADVDAAAAHAKGLGLFIRSLVGLDRQAAVEAFGHYLDGSRFTVGQIRFVNLIVDELTQNGLMEPGRLFESPYTDHAPTGPDRVFPRADVEVIVDILHQVRDRALPVDVA